LLIFPFVGWRAYGIDIRDPGRAVLRIGYGSAFAEVPVDLEPGREVASLAFLSRSRPGRALGSLFYTEASTPVLASSSPPGLLLAARHRPAALSTSRSCCTEPAPKGPAVSVVQIGATFGPEHLLHTQRRVDGRIVTYQSRGTVLPDSCPTADSLRHDLAFQDGSPRQRTRRGGLPNAPGPG